MQPEGYTALYTAVSKEPSNWALHRAVVEYYRRTFGNKEIVTYVDYPILHQQEQLFPGNEYPFLGAAVYQSRVRRDYKLALEFADKALILNPGNPKALAVRGMIRLSSGGPPASAFEDLAKALELAPKSLGDEPESHQAALALLKVLLGSGEPAKAERYLETLGDLTPLGSDQRLRETGEYRELLEAFRRAEKPK